MDPKMMLMLDMLPRDSELRTLMIEPELMRVAQPWANPAVVGPYRTPIVKVGHAAGPVTAMSDATRRALESVIPRLEAIASTAPAEDAKAIRSAIAILRGESGPKENGAAARTKKAPIAAATKLTKTMPAVQPVKEGIKMTTTKTGLTASDMRAHFARVLKSTTNEAERRRATEMVRFYDGRAARRAAEAAAEPIDPLTAQRAEMDRKMGITSGMPVAVHDGARHGARAISSGEARAEIARRGKEVA